MKLQLLIAAKLGNAVASDNNQTKINKTAQVNTQKICEITGAISNGCSARAHFCAYPNCEINPPSYH
jgi:hypothetical protein